MLISYNVCSSNHFSISSRFPCFLRSWFFSVQVFNGRGFSSFSGSRFFRVQVYYGPGFQGPGFQGPGPGSGSRVQVQGSGPRVRVQGPGSRVQGLGPLSGPKVWVQVMEVAINM